MQVEIAGARIGREEVRARAPAETYGAVAEEQCARWLIATCAPGQWPSSCSEKAEPVLQSASPGRER